MSWLNHVRNAFRFEPCTWQEGCLHAVFGRKYEFKFENCKNLFLLRSCRDPAVDTGVLKEYGGHVLIGTPGRLEDILQRCNFLDLRTVEALVLDEADRLLDMGFKSQVCCWIYN